MFRDANKCIIIIKKTVVRLPKEWHTFNLWHTHTHTCMLFAKHANEEIIVEIN